jgi:RNA polymerase sigma-70 factor (ECF subfamily)
MKAVQPLLETVASRGGDMFPPTHWSVIVAAGESQVAPEKARAALTELCQTYWPPLYSFIRARGYSVHDAQDLTQNFFAFLIEQKIYTRVDRSKGKFRSFLLASLKHFLANTYHREHALKRGGGHELLPLNEQRLAEVESTIGSYPNRSANEDCLFERTWAQMLVKDSLEKLSTDYKSEGKEKLFEQLRIFLTGSADPLPSYVDLAHQLGIAASSVRSSVTRMRARYREALRAEVRRTVDKESEVEEELRELLRVLTTV